MAEVLLFHHAQGLTEGVEVFAEEVREAGHVVLVPDLYDGATFDTIEAGGAHAEGLGFENILEEGVRIAEGLAEGLVYAGFSLGALVAHRLAQTRAGALGALLYHHGDVPIHTFGDSWPEGVDLQIHVSEGDPFYDRDVAADFVERARASADAELFVYPGSAHLFTDSSLSDYDADSAALVMERTLAFLGRLD
ncbi:MAG: dienelactone hydrolase family protein [Actinobacteria bacterium]|nr:dienelactone hydrolase family protein [Actinomycetota bacterium]